MGLGMWPQPHTGRVILHMAGEPRDIPVERGQIDKQRWRRDIGDRHARFCRTAEAALWGGGPIHGG